MNTTNHTDSSATSGDLTAAHAKIYRDAIALVCEGWYLPNDARKVLETALWAQPEAAPAPQAATPLPGGQDERAEEKSLSDYQPGQWWLDELENLWGHHGEVSADTHRAAKVACDFAKLVFAQQAAPAVPIPMILHCPSCGVQHVDAPDERTEGWINPPHRSHLCHGCGHIWRPADVPTEGVRSIQTRGKNDSPVAAPEAPTAWIADVIRDVAELPDRDSPADQPDMMLVSAEELREIIERRATTASTEMTAEQARAALQAMPLEAVVGMVKGATTASAMLVDNLRRTLGNIKDATRLADVRSLANLGLGFLDAQGEATTASASGELTDLEARQRVAEALGLGRSLRASFAWSYLLGVIEECAKDDDSLALAPSREAAPLDERALAKGDGNG